MRLASPLAALVFTSTAFAHGGVWRPPGGDVTSPGGAGAPTTPGRSGATTGGARKGSPDLDRWEAWWYFQRETYLPRHAAGLQAMTAAHTGLREGRTAGAASPPPPDSPLLPAEARARVLPVLVAALKDKSTEVVDAAAIALGRSVESAAAGPFLTPLMNTLTHSHRSPQQAAVIGLGILGGAEAAAMLREIAVDSATGRQLCAATGPLDDLLRGLACLALGLAQQPANVPLLAAIARSATDPRDVSACAVLALGLQHDAAQIAAVELVKLVDDDELDRAVRAQVPIALQRLPDARGLLPKLAALLASRQTPPEVARSLVIALGNLARPEESEVVNVLVSAAKSHDDPATRHFAMLALGRLFERDGAPTPEAREQRQKVQEWLIGELKDADRRSNRPFAAITLGLIGRGDRLHDPEGKSSAVTLTSGRKLADLLVSERDPSHRGAYAIAVGLLAMRDAGASLRAELDFTENPILKSHFSTALALLGDREAIPRLREMLQDRSLNPGVRIDVARALGMLEDRDFECQLLDLMAKADDIPQAAAFAKALGLLGGRDAIEPLVELAEDRTLPEFRRAFAVVALGLLAEKTELPWNAVYLVDANYTVALRPLLEIFDLL